MQPHSWVAIVTIAALLVYVWMAARIARARRKCGIQAPTMTGDPVLERHIRVQANTLEWLPLFLPSLWLFAIYISDGIAAAIGLVWVIGRVLYVFGYAKAVKDRSRGFAIQALAAIALWVGAIGAIVWRLVHA